MDNPVLIILEVLVVVLLAVLIYTQFRRRPEQQSQAPVLNDEFARQMMAQITAAQTKHTGSMPSPAELEQAKKEAAELRRQAALDADKARAAATAAAEELRAAAVAQAEAIRSTARDEVSRERKEIRVELDQIRQRAQDEGLRAAELASVALKADRADLLAAQQAFTESSAQLARDLRAFDSERAASVAARAEVDAGRTALEVRQEALHRDAAALQLREAELADQASVVTARAVEHERELERIGGLTVDEAKNQLLTKVEVQVRREAAIMTRRIEAEAEATAKQKARVIVADAVQKVASDQTSQSVVSVVHLPAEEVKGRIIGREGRNIRTFETVTGVNVIIDDTPEAVLLSCFDPVRREVGRVTLMMLIEDGRIHPHRIEEAYERAQDEVEALCHRAAEDAMVEVGIAEVHPELMKLLGHLKYRTSYGQNVLGHMVETGHIARGIAYEMGIDPAIVVRGAFLHDIGKALTHEARGSHAIVGAELARRYGESEEVAHCIEAHHDEVSPSTIEAVLTQASDSCSGGRPGARRESLESYVQRMERIEAIASAKNGVEKVFAMQAGRELRVMVKPDVVDDIEAHMIAREVAKQIEEELTYPGQVRVTVIRESRATEIAR
ncbi:ribonuclease Y [Nakamurella antarctica]|uniref:Ribonuclease Y n=1 Tax=Nakamurella antarctica TaxID=1902245 RepID=A0A3G8ZVD1_9ACTN|nr:ribonuclease Y [Nakamurella antarctica]AZI57641.1 ribonuclease Y [Nakamurella antarctica]